MKRPAWTQQEMSLLQAVFLGAAGVASAVAGLAARYIFHNQAGAVWLGTIGGLTVLVAAFGAWHLAGSTAHKNAQALKSVVLDKMAGHLDEAWDTPSGATLEAAQTRVGYLFTVVSVRRMPPGGWNPRPGTDYGLTFATQYEVNPATPGVFTRQVPYRIHRTALHTTREYIPDPLDITVTTRRRPWTLAKKMRAAQAPPAEIWKLITEIRAAHLPDPGSWPRLDLR